MIKFDLFFFIKNFFNLGFIQISGILLQFLLMPLITRRYGVEIFGEFVLTTNFAYLIGNLINFGTNQTEIKKISINHDNNNKLSLFISNTLWLRMFIFFVFSFFSLFFIFIYSNNYILIWLSLLPFLIAEIFNPIYFLIGIEKLSWITWGNIITRSISYLLIFFTTIKLNDSILLNLFIGTPLLVFYLVLMLFLLKQYQLKLCKPNIDFIIKNLKNNFHVTFNGSVGMLQQTIFLFFIANNYSMSILGSYAIIDKLLNAFRQFISVFSTSIYPRSAQIFYNNKPAWLTFRFQIRRLYIYFSLIASLILFYFSEQIVTLISNDHNRMTSYFIKLLSPSLIFLSMNATNVLDFLLNEQYEGMFIVSIFILINTILISFILTSHIYNISIGWYPLLIEASCFFIYTYAVKKFKLNAI